MVSRTHAGMKLLRVLWKYTLLSSILGFADAGKYAYVSVSGVAKVTFAKCHVYV